MRERYDVAAAIESAEFAEDPPLPHRWLLGWSFGTDLALSTGSTRPSRARSCSRRRCASPPTRTSTRGPRRASRCSPWSRSSTTTCVRTRPRRRFARIPQAEVVGVDGAKHLWVGEPAVRRVLDEIVKRVAPEAYPLPTEWPCPTEPLLWVVTGSRL